MTRRDPRDDPKYQRLKQRAQGANRSLAEGLEQDARNGHVDWSKMQQNVEKAEKIRDLANELAGESLDSPRAKKKLKTLEGLAGGKGAAKKAVENANISGGARESTLRKFLRGW